MPLRLDVRQRELDLAVDTSGPDERRVERLDPVRGHDDLDVAAGVEPVQLVQQLEHGPLDLALATRCRVVPLGTDGVDLVDEHNRRRVLLCNPEQLTDELGPVAEVLLNELGADDAEERRGRLIRDGLREQRLTGSWNAVENNTLGRLDAHLLVELGVSERELNRFLSTR
jgi:hypothetical protein